MAVSGDSIRAAADAVEKVGNSKWAGFLVFAGIAAIGWTIFESRQAVILALQTNQVLLFVTLGSMLVVSVGWIFSRIQQRVYERYDQQIADLRQQVTDIRQYSRELETRLVDLQLRYHTETKAVLDEILEAVRHPRS